MGKCLKRLVHRQLRCGSGMLVLSQAKDSKQCWLGERIYAKRVAD